MEKLIHKILLVSKSLSVFKLFGKGVGSLTFTLLEELLVLSYYVKGDFSSQESNLQKEYNKQYEKMASL